MNKVSWIIFSAVVVVLLGGLIVWARVSNPSVDVSTIDNNSVLAGSAESGNIADHTKGTTDGKVLIVEYGDFQCPSCKGAYPNVKTLMEEYGDRVGLVFRNFPLTSIHPNAKAAAAAAEAAGLQGKFWEMHDLLYANQTTWGSLSTSQRTDAFVGYASQLSLDTSKFTSDLSSENVNSKINFDLSLGKANDTSATPTFFINGEKLDEKTASGIVNGDLTAIKEKLDSLLAE